MTTQLDVAELMSALGNFHDIEVTNNRVIKVRNKDEDWTYVWETMKPWRPNDPAPYEWVHGSYFEWIDDDGACWG